MKILKEVLSEIKPSPEIEKEIKSKISSVLSILKKKFSDAKIVLGGSGEKGTWLKDANDADIFVCFNYNKYKDKSNMLSDIVEKKLKGVFSGINRLHGSRDYFQFEKHGFDFEIVPIIEVKDSSLALNITDVSPLHAKWVLSKSDDKLRDDIRLTKQFCKANKCYGAESYIKGFSGYMCEVLTIYYGSFLKLVRAAAKWDEKVIVDAEKYYKGKDVMMELNKSKTYSPMIIVDPVQKDRNAAAALSVENFTKFKDACNKFIAEPKKESFSEKTLSIDDLKKKAGKKELIVLEFKTLERKEDVAGAKMVKAIDYVSAQLSKNDFKIVDSGWEWDREKEGIIYFIVDAKKLDPFKMHKGPSVAMVDHVAFFKKKHKDTFVKSGVVYAKVKRDFVEPFGFVKNLVKDQYIKEKFKDIKCKQ